MTFQRTSVVAVLLLSSSEISAFQARSQLSFRSNHNAKGHWKLSPLHQAAGDNEEIDWDTLKAELTAYLETRKELDADSAAKEQVGRVVGGTKGE